MTLTGEQAVWVLVIVATLVYCAAREAEPNRRLRKALTASEDAYDKQDASNHASDGKGDPEEHDQRAFIGRRSGLADGFKDLCLNVEKNHRGNKTKGLVYQLLHCFDCTSAINQSAIPSVTSLEEVRQDGREQGNAIAGEAVCRASAPQQAREGEDE